MVPQKVYRGISGTSGTHSASYGRGLYTTADKGYARQFAGADGEVLEMDAREALPRNPLIVRDAMDFENWRNARLIALGFKTTGSNGQEFPDLKRFNREHPDMAWLVRQSGHDGVQIGKGRDRVWVKYPSTAESFVDDLLDGDLIAEARADPRPTVPWERVKRRFLNPVMEDDRSRSENLNNWSGATRRFGPATQMVPVYRWVHADAPENDILPGDWVTANLDYLDGYAGTTGGRILTGILPASELVDAQTGEKDGDTLIWIPD